MVAGLTTAFQEPALLAHLTAGGLNV